MDSLKLLRGLALEGGARANLAAALSASFRLLLFLNSLAWASSSSSCLLLPLRRTHPFSVILSHVHVITEVMARLTFENCTFYCASVFDSYDKPDFRLVSPPPPDGLT
jgi:hypothetical protein